MTAQFTTQTTLEGLTVILLIWGLIREDSLALIERRIMLCFRRIARRALRKIVCASRRRRENPERAKING
jgi:hypothetical protein